VDRGIEPASSINHTSHAPTSAALQKLARSDHIGQKAGRSHFADILEHS
jgi:hypothetical protein